MNKLPPWVHPRNRAKNVTPRGTPAETVNTPQGRHFVNFHPAGPRPTAWTPPLPWVIHGGGVLLRYTEYIYISKWISFPSGMDLLQHGFVYRFAPPSSPQSTCAANPPPIPINPQWNQGKSQTPICTRMQIHGKPEESYMVKRSHAQTQQQTRKLTNKNNNLGLNDTKQ